jgi:hypothetical protein
MTMFPDFEAARKPNEVVGTCRGNNDVKSRGEGDEVKGTR